MAAQTKSWWNFFRDLAAGVKRAPLAILRILSRRPGRPSPAAVRFEPLPEKRAGNITVVSRNRAAVLGFPVELYKSALSVHPAPGAAWMHHCIAEASAGLALAGLGPAPQADVYVVNGRPRPPAISALPPASARPSPRRSSSPRRASGE